MAGTIIDECDRLLEMINAMLDISEAEAGLARLHSEAIDIGALVRDVCELFQSLAEEKGVTLTLQLPVRLYVSGDLRKLQRVLANLLDNAIKYTPAGGHVRIFVAAEEKQVTMSRRRYRHRRIRKKTCPTFSTGFSEERRAGQHQETASALHSLRPLSLPMEAGSR